ncbi:MAG: transcriptional regulator BetI [Paracoccaceae bacterium]
MPKVGMEPIRRSALVEATIAEVGAAGHLDVTVSQIAKRAGMSSALAHHYFGGKDQIMTAAMRHILREFGAEVRAAMAAAKTPYDRVLAIVETSFSPSCFDPATVLSWMTLYAQAPTHPDMLRLLKLYQYRLHSNLCHALRPLSADPSADAATIAALIDGLYLRAALARGIAPQDALRILRRTLNQILKVPQ